MKINTTMGIFDSIDITNGVKRTITLTFQEQKELIDWFRVNRREFLK